MTPFLAMVLVGFAAFMTVLGVVWARGAIAALREPKR